MHEDFYHFFTRYFGNLGFGVTMAVTWLSTALALLMPNRAKLGFVGRLRWRRRTRVTVVVSTYLLIGVLIAPAYFGSTTNFLWSPPNIIHNLFVTGGLENVLLWPFIVIACAGDC